MLPILGRTYLSLFSLLGRVDGQLHRPPIWPLGQVRSLYCTSLKFPIFSPKVSPWAQHYHSTELFGGKSMFTIDSASTGGEQRRASWLTGCNVVTEKNYLHGSLLSLVGPGGLVPGAWSQHQHSHCWDFPGREWKWATDWLVGVDCVGYVGLPSWPATSRK